ncbi:iron-containing alcohol dehydrogenase [Rubripirellula sp.]|nr:iron-containing alcohol dehydrogenase [Rubripirellula sp.]MDB4338953.1 iron-containing alcohol dehydrogenase [Rubripirellula sp.]
MQPFDTHNRTRIIFGEGKIDCLGKVASDFRPVSVLVVSDRGIREAGHHDRAVRALEKEGIKVRCFHEFSENPTSAMVDAGVQVAAEVKPDLLVGIGGGSSMDCCKAINFVYCCGGSIHDYHGTGKATSDLLPMIAIPTTAGTGSEAQSYALISDAETHIKMACGDARAAAKVAILDPQLTITQPELVTALTGIDAISHSIETHVSTRRNAVSTTYSRRAFGMLANSFERVLNEPEDIEARSMMQLGAYYAGLAIENSMLGAAHATANPMTARHNITHGQAVGVMLPAVVNMNGQQCSREYAELIREIDPSTAEEEATERLRTQILCWLEKADLATSIHALKITPDSLQPLVAEALQQWTGNFNPLPLDEENVQALYCAAISNTFPDLTKTNVRSI